MECNSTYKIRQFQKCITKQIITTSSQSPQQPPQPPSQPPLHLHQPWLLPLYSTTPPEAAKLFFSDSRTHTITLILHYGGYFRTLPDVAIEYTRGGEGDGGELNVGTVGEVDVVEHCAKLHVGGDIGETGVSDHGLEGLEVLVGGLGEEDGGEHIELGQSRDVAKPDVTDHDVEGLDKGDDGKHCAEVHVEGLDEGDGSEPIELEQSRDVHIELDQCRDVGEADVSNSVEHTADDLSKGNSGEHIGLDNFGAICEGYGIEEHDIGQGNVGVQDDVNVEYLNDFDSLLDSDYDMESESDDDDDDALFEKKMLKNGKVWQVIQITWVTIQVNLVMMWLTMKMTLMHISCTILCNKNKKNFKFVKNYKIRVYVRCVGEECEWRINALKMKNECTFQITEFNLHHSCPQTFHKYIQKFQSNTKRNVRGFRLDMVNDIRCHVFKDQAYRAQKKALKLIEGSPNIQYTKLDERFSRFYIFFNAFKKGFLSGCRPIIRVDSCHLKGPYGGVLLTTIGTDPNNNLYPIAYAIICKEYLNIVITHEYAFMSDKQKGLIQAFQEVFPNSDHRFCVRHLHNNFKNVGFRGLAFKNALWREERASTPSEFKVKMMEMRDLNESVANWFNGKPPNQWSRSYFSEHCKCDMLFNNVCDFNRNILDAREKLIITIFEWIREFLMRRLQENRDKAEAKWKVIEKHLKKVGDCIAIKAGDRHCQISCMDGSQYYVDLEKWSCTCRMWGLSGIPCKHTICAIFNQNQLPEDFMLSCYTVETYEKVYAYIIIGISGEQLWGEIMFIPHLPPNFGRGVGKPSKAQRRELDEVNVKQKKRSRSHTANQTVEGTSGSIQNVGFIHYILIIYFQQC
ncbi:hypothetical protein Pfo_022614 [Paulownia fortunei]|nr:hypothetical protein Pfo_022614 [Paulownia fortunei]